MNLKKFILRKKLETTGVACSVNGCDESAVQVDELLPFDPIDHDPTVVAVCPTHQAWADERNAFAKEIADELREYRKEVGQERIAEIQRLCVPQGQMREDVLMGDVQERFIRLSDAIEEPL